ncbi:MAG TPA: hypothetical protein VFM88_15320, partial [Vicinamibacteria bacterium]|nr:hypothetical protein [Vicinamibacteria bacterium]
APREAVARPTKSPDANAAMKKWQTLGLPALLAVAPLLFAGLTGPRMLSTFRATGDHAAIELYTREAAAGRQLVGPHSRYGFHHPGPAFFYAAVPLYLAVGERYAGIQMTATLIAAVAFVAMIACASYGAGAAPAWAAAFALSLAVHARGVGSIVSAWNPNVTALAFGTLLFALACLFAGAMRALPLAVVAGSLAVQSHLGCAPAALILGVLTAAALAWPALRSRARLPVPERRGPYVVAISGGLLIVLWAPTLLDALAPGAGNLGTLAAFLAAPAPGHPLSDAAAVVGGQVPALASGSARGLVAGGLFAAACWTAVAAYRRAAHTTLGLSLLCAAGIVLATVSAMRAGGPLYPYLIRWSWTFWVGIVAALLHVGMLAVGERWQPDARARQLLAGAGAVALAALALAASWRVLQDAEEDDEHPQLQSERVERLADALQATLRERGLRRPLIAVADPAAHPLGLGLLLELDKRGASFAAQPFGVFRFPPAWRPGSEDATLVLDRLARSQRRGELVIREGPYRLELLSDG